MTVIRTLMKFKKIGNFYTLEKLSTVAPLTIIPEMTDAFEKVLEFIML